jgi:broad specificity phosphatase PhoE
MRKLILIRHSQTAITPGIPSRQWPLTEEGRRRCHALATRLKSYDVQNIVTSVEPKAVETGQLIARLLDIPTITADNLQEHDRSNTGAFYADPQGFKAILAELFNNPQTLIFGSETADQAHVRFADAVRGVLEHYPTGNLAIVTHATVLTLFVSRLAGLEPFAYWDRLGMPAYVVLSLPDLKLLETVENV